ncbi:hypothetical protein, partial [Providencia sp. PROV033]|uniref:hypothetical protein n=1 Tax=Providencia sp. PROV033 TaxID=2949765 RepID=UPI00234A980A
VIWLYAPELFEGANQSTLLPPTNDRNIRKYTISVIRLQTNPPYSGILTAVTTTVTIGIRHG